MNNFLNTKVLWRIIQIHYLVFPILFLSVGYWAPYAGFQWVPFS